MHFTYASPDNTSLYQGDLLARTPGVDDLLREVHPHYYNKPDDYHYLQVLTQSCDLVKRRDSGCNARYIALAAVRPFDLVLRREVEKYQRDPLAVAGGFCDLGSKAKVWAFLERLFNNNENEYFYLNEEPSVGLDQPHCAFLALSISVKSQLHYDTLLAAKIAQLQESFQHKLGWLVGNMYSRVGTDDWVPTAGSSEDFERKIDQTLKDYVLWVAKEHQRALIKKLKTEPDVNPEVAAKHLAEVRRTIPRRKDVVVETVGEILTKLGVDPDVVQKARNRITNDPAISSIISGDVTA
jgi:hypothetical protein